MKEKPQIVHHITTALGAMQVHETSKTVQLDFVNTTTGVNISVDRYRDEWEVGTSIVSVLDTPNITVYWTHLEDIDDPKYRNVVSVCFEETVDGTLQTSMVDFYIDPHVFKTAVEAMTISGETQDDNES